MNSHILAELSHQAGAIMSLTLAAALDMPHSTFTACPSLSTPAAVPVPAPLVYVTSDTVGPA